MNVLDELRLGEIEQFVVALEVFLGLIAKPRSAKPFFAEAIAFAIQLIGVLRGPIDDADASLEEGDERMTSRGRRRTVGGQGTGLRRHGRGPIKNGGPRAASNKLSYRDSTMDQARSEWDRDDNLPRSFSDV